MTTQFDDIYHGLTRQPGKLRIAASGLAWKNPGTEDIVALPAPDIKWAQWMRVARNYRVRFGLKDRRREMFDGFLRDDHDKLAGLLKQHFGIILEQKEISHKGWNWGAHDFQGQDLAFLISNKTAFELPLGNVANSNIAGKTEVSLEFSTSSKSKPAGDEMVEIRFYVPGVTTKEVTSDAEGEEKDEEKPEVDGEEVSAAQAFHDTIKEKAELGEVSGNMIITFEEVLVTTPRGRYDIDMFPEFLRLRGKTYDYKISYDGISKLFLLPKDDQHVQFVLSLVNPIRQGQTRYQFLVMQFDREEEITAELNMEEEEIAKYDKLQKHYESLTFEVISSVFRALSRNKIIGAGSFQSRDGNPGVKANLKAVQGDLFILEKFIFFVAKAPLLIEMSDIHSINFSRVGTSMATSRTFDIEIITKSGPSHTFTSIPKEEFEHVETYLKSKKVRVKNKLNDADIATARVLEDDDDEEMQSVASSGDDEPRPRLGGDDDDSEDDESFKASSSDAGSPSEEESDDSQEAASASDASGDREIAKQVKSVKKKKAPAGEGAAKKPKPKKKAPADGGDAEKGAESDAMDVDEDKPKPKPKPKPKAKPKDGGAEEPAKKKQKKDSSD